MRRIPLLRRRSARVVALVAVASLVGAGITYAAIPSSSTGRITACYATSGTKAGLLRIIDAQIGQKCLTGEKSVNWQTNGVRFMRAYNGTATYYAGDVVTHNGSSWVALTTNKGVTPVAGTRWGTFAARGATGATGPAGSTGATGPQGPAGPAGPTHGRVITQVIAPAAQVGSSASLIVKPDGTPFIAYAATARPIRGFDCVSVNCTTTVADRELLPPPGLGNLSDPRAVLLGTGHPAFVYQDESAIQLRYVRCLAPDCSSLDTSNFIDGPGTFSRPALTVGVDGMPVMAYSKGTELIVARCADAACATNPSRVSLTQMSIASASITIAPSGSPVLAVQERAADTPGRLWLLACSTGDCSGDVTQTLVDGTDDTGYTPKVAIGPNGFPVIAYASKTANSMKVAFCSNATCTSKTLGALASSAQLPEVWELAINADGGPAIAFHDDEIERPRVTICTAGCAAITQVEVPDGPALSGSGSMAIAPDGRYLLAYHLASTGSLRLVSITRTAWAANGWG